MAQNGGKRPGAGRKPGVPNRTNRELRELAQQYTEEAVITAAEIMRNDDEPAPARIKAVEILLGYGHGKPRQALDVEGKLTLEQIVAASLRHDDSGPGGA